jgi:light-regulated signal transduction histidine kinase (bacteriophytochrome)
MLEVTILAIALSMDAFAVSIGLGSKGNSKGLGLKAGLYFGVFQALMPFIGYLGGKGVLGWVEDYAHWIAFDLLALSRAARSPKQRQRLALDKCVNAALEALQVRIEETSAAIERDTLPEVWGDPTILTQLYQNLVSNAIKFSDQQPPRIRITAERVKGRWILGVRDNGIGINPEYATQIFRPFQRLHGAGKYSGSGIGLAICLKAVERHGGEIWVEPAAEGGSHFKFYLRHRTGPRAPAESDTSA